MIFHNVLNYYLWLGSCIVKSSCTLWNGLAHLGKFFSFISCIIFSVCNFVFRPVDTASIHSVVSNFFEYSVFKIREWKENLKWQLMCGQINLLLLSSSSRALQSVVDFGFQYSFPPFLTVLNHCMPISYSHDLQILLSIFFFLDLCPSRNPKHPSGWNFSCIIFSTNLFLWDWDVNPMPNPHPGGPGCLS
jgi:hypothetical protein